MNNLALVFRRIAQFDSAVAYYDQAATLARETGDHYGQGVVLNNLGSVLWAVGRHEAALEKYRTALEVRRSIGDRSGEAQTLNNIGTVLDDTGHLDSARAYYLQALQIRRAVGDRPGLGTSLNNVGAAFLAQGVLDSAEAYFTEALEVRRSIGARGGEALALHNLAVVATRRSDAVKAVGYERQALEIRRKVGDREGVAVSLRSLGSIYHRVAGRGDPVLAAAYYDSAAAAYSEISVRAGGDANRVSLAEATIELYRQWALAWLARSGDIGAGDANLAALAVTDRGRAQALLNLMRDTTATPLRTGGDLIAEGSALLSAFGKPGAGALIYLETADTLVTFVIGPAKDLSVVRRAIPLDTLRQMVRAFRASLKVDDADASPAARGLALESEQVSLAGVQPQGSWRRQSEVIANVLLPAIVRKRIGAAHEIMIVPQGSMALVPFTALAFGRAGAALGSQVAVRYGPSLATVARAEARTGGSTARDMRGALVVANPPMPEVKVANGTRQTLAPLPGAAAEGRAVASYLRASLRTGSEATETTVRRLLSDAPLVHLATHAFAYSGAESARESFVALAPGEGNDGRFTVSEILGDPAVKLTADLVVLSACQTGLGNLRQAEGTVGLQRAFLAKGASSLLVSLWSVSDAATRAVMERFYRHWLRDVDHPSKAEALRRSQDEVRKMAGWDHPRFWAAFQLVGAG